ncbi:MAG: flagellar biogenesis protein [Treponema sp.]|jgi:flagellar biosynthesis protein|nr:flagellar biogenesis protein [Treponema sp.]
MRKTATALLYTKNTRAPVITAQGKGEIAEQILKIAKEHEVRIIKDIETASILSLVEIGECIPIETYEIIAKLLAFIEKSI